MPEFILQVISGVQVGRKIKVESEITLGRSNQNGIHFSGPDGTLVSSNHACITIENDTLVLRDLGSTNGTFVNGEQVEEAILGPNAIVSLGANGPKLRVLPPPGATGTETLHRGAGTISGTQATQSGRASSTSSIQRGRNIPSPGFPPAGFPPAGDAGNYTMGLAQRLGNDEVDQKEFQALIRDKRRAKRIAQAGVLNKRDARLIEHAAGTYSSGRHRWRIVLISVSVVALIIVGFLGAQNLGYRRKLAEQKDLLGTIQTLEAQLESQSASGNASAETPETAEDPDKMLLVAKLRAAERQLMNLRTHINSKDLVSTYKNPLGREIHVIMEQFGKKDYIVPDIFIEEVEKLIVIFTKTSSRRILEKSFANKPLHQRTIERELMTSGMPMPFFYLSMHESMLDSTIISSVGARGLWQFMPPTARQYGLSVPSNWESLPPEMDERTQPIKSTKAGVLYLKHLYAEFGDVALAMAAYNAGEGRIRGALRKIDDPVNNRDFWYIYRLGALPLETKQYVPKIIATMVIDRNRARYGFPP